MTINAVARRAGVSIATVSRVLNGSAKVSPGTAEQVRLAIEALSFYPDTNARALGSGRSSLYGLIISDITNPFFPELVKAFEDIAVAHGQEVLIANTDYDPQRMEHCVSRMLQRKVDGVAIMTSEMDEHLIEVFSRRRVPLVFLDAPPVSEGISSIRIDYQFGVSLAMEHLFALGHQRISFLAGPSRLHSARVREHAFVTEMLDRRLPVDERSIQAGNHRVDGGYQAMERILSHPGPLPTAVLCSNDLTAIGAMSALHNRGLRIPADVSIVGCDDILFSACTSPALTTLGISRSEIAGAAFRSLFNHRGRKPGEPIAEEGHFLRPVFVERQSTGPVPVQAASPPEPAGSPLH